MKEKLAIEGGEPAIQPTDLQPWCAISDADRAAIARVLDRNETAGPSAPETVALQKEWATYLGMNHAILTNSGTAALHMALASAGVQPGDEVIVPAYSFVASAMSIMHQNAIPVFADTEKGTFNIDPASVEAAISPRTKALMIVHINGMPARMQELMEIAHRNGISVVEDACQAHGAKYTEKPVGSFGVAGAFSLNKSKNLPAGEGGLFVSNDNEITAKAGLLSTFGELPSSEIDRDYHSVSLGWMYRSTEFVAALARSRLQMLDTWNAIRRRNVERLNELLDGIPGIRTMQSPDNTEPVYWRYAFQVVPEEIGNSLPPHLFRKALQEVLIAEGLTISQWQKRILPAQDVFQLRQGYGEGCPWDCHSSSIEYEPSHYPNAQEIIDRTLWLKDGIQPPNYEETVEKIAYAVAKSMSRAEDFSHLVDL